MSILNRDSVMALMDIFQSLKTGIEWKNWLYCVIDQSGIHHVWRPSKIFVMPRGKEGSTYCYVYFATLNYGRCIFFKKDMQR